MECCLKPTNVGTVVSRQIHSFSDARPTGYGQETYLRITNEKGDIHWAFLMGKARVAPVKTTTTPRLELTAAALSVRVENMITRELEEPVESKFCWLDSTTVLKYKWNAKKLSTCFSTWWEQPQSSWWCTFEHRWIISPSFWSLPNTEWPLLPTTWTTSVEDLDVKRVVVHSMEITENDERWSRLRRFSEWLQLKGVNARILRLKTKDSSKSHPKEDGVLRDQRARSLAARSLKVEKVDRAEKTIRRLVQSHAFPKEIEIRKMIWTRRLKGRPSIRLDKEVWN